MSRPRSFRLIWLATAGLAALALVPPPPAAAAPGGFASRSAAHPALTANALSQVQTSRRLMSADGRFLVFASRATDLVAGVTDGNGTWDVFLYDRESGEVSLVSRHVYFADETANGESQPRAISADGRFVAFGSLATDLSGLTDGNGTWDAFLWDRETRTVTQVSRAYLSPMASASGATIPSRLSADGEWMLLRSTATDFAPGGTTDSNGAEDVFLWRRSNRDVQLVSHRPSDDPGLYEAGNGASSPQTISPDGRWVVYTSAATDLVAGGSDGNGAADVFLFDRHADRSTLVSHRFDATTTAGAGASGSAFSLSADGRWLAYQTTATDLIFGIGVAGTTDVYLWDRDANANTLVSRGWGNPAAEANASSDVQAMSADGRSVLFSSKATDLLAAFVDGNGPAAADAWVWDRTTGAVTLISHLPASAATGGNGESVPRLASANGRFVALDTLATDLVAGESDENGGGDVLVWERGSGALRLASSAAGLPLATGNGETTLWGMSASGAFLSVETLAEDVIPNALDENDVRDVLHLRSPFPILHEDAFESGSLAGWSRAGSE